jgi:hypothetical protein
MIDINWEYDAAWQEAWQRRSCPPEDILFGEKTIELTAHLDICPACRDLREIAGTNEASQLYQKISTILCQSRPEPLSPNHCRPGQVWSLKQELGGWGPKMRYYEPPLMLLLADIDEAAVKVAQVHEMPQFKQPDDIALENGLNGFAESWNSYTLSKADLSHCLGQVENTVVDKVIKLSQAQADKIPANSLLYIFRQLEIETGYFFSSRAVASLMEQYEQQGESEKHTGKFRDFSKALPTAANIAALEKSSFVPPGKIVSLEEYLLGSRLEEKRLAAASGDGIYFSGPALVLDEDEKQVVIAAHGRHDVTDYDPVDHSLALDGSIDDMPGYSTDMRIVFAWHLPDGRLVSATDFRLDLDEKRFSVIFDDIPSMADVDKGQLRICVIDGKIIHDE